MKTPSGNAARIDGSCRGRELEIKFATDAAGLERAGGSDLLAGAKARRPGRNLRTVYYDTPASDLWKQRTVLRMRKAGRGYLMAVKWPGQASEGVFARGEIEIAMPDAQPDIGRFDEATAVRLRDHIGAHDLEPKFITQFKRHVFDLDTGNAQIEVALDEGFIVAGERREALMEIELELKSGDTTALYDVAMRLARAAPLRLGMLSKGERGFMLAGGTAPTSSKAQDPVLHADATLDEAVAVILGASLDHFVRNIPALDTADGVEAVHQMRVALRRMRTAFALFDRVLPCPEFGEFRTAAKQLASALGGARDWDVFRELVEAGPLRGRDRDTGFEALFAGAEAHRATAYAAARGVIEGAETTRFVVGLQGFLARRAWRTGLDAEQLPRLTERARDFAARDIERLHHRALRRGKDLLQASPAQRHEVRIALKNLRYAGDFFAMLFDPAGVRARVKLIGRLQAALGNYNDGVTAVGLARTAQESAGAAAAEASGIVQGWYARASTDDAELGELWKRFRSTPPVGR